MDPEIFFNGRCGMVRYYSVLARELAKRGMRVTVPLLVSESDFIAGRWQFLRTWNRWTPRDALLRIMRRLSKRWYYANVRKGAYDVLLLTSPVFEDEVLRHLPANKPCAMVVHDTMRCVLGPDGLFDPAGPHADRLAYLAARAASVICISEHTKQDLLRLVPGLEGVCTTLYTGNLLGTGLGGIAPREKLPKRYLLFVGERTGRKNFRFTMQALAGWLREQPDLGLVCTGRTNRWEQHALEMYGVQNKIVFIEADDEHLAYLYRHALALIYPSLYEGFGLPVLEAMASGCPVIASRCGALEEVGGDAVCYIDPLDKDSIVKAVRRLAEDRAYAGRLAEAGKQRADCFTLDAMMDRFASHLRQLGERAQP